MQDFPSASSEMKIDSHLYTLGEKELPGMKETSEM